MKTMTLNASAHDDMSPELEKYAIVGSDETQSACFGFAGGEEVLFDEAEAGHGRHDEVLQSLPRQPRGTDVANVGPKKQISSLEEECRFNAGKLRKIRRLAQTYSDWRAVRGDGNCFYRTVIFGAIEAFMAAGDRQRLNSMLESLQQVQYPSAREQKAHEQLVQVMRTWQTAEQLELWISQDAGLDQALVRACRRLVRQYLTEHADDKTPSGLSYNELVRALDSAYHSIEDYCRLVVDPLGRDAETLALDALPQELGVGLRMWILDRRDEVELVSLDTVGPDGQVDVHMLFKPGHYDLLYPGISKPVPETGVWKKSMGGMGWPIEVAWAR